MVNSPRETPPPGTPPAVVPPPATPQEQASLGDLFQALSNDTSLLIRQEAALAKAEMQQKIDKITTDIGMIAGGAGLALFGAIALLIALIWGVGVLLDSIWLSALIIGVIFLAVGGVLIYQAIQKIKELNPKPEQTIETLQEDKEWAKRQIQQ